MDLTPENAEIEPLGLHYVDIWSQAQKIIKSMLLDTCFDFFWNQCQKTIEIGKSKVLETISWTSGAEARKCRKERCIIWLASVSITEVTSNIQLNKASIADVTLLYLSLVRMVLFVCLRCATFQTTSDEKATVSKMFVDFYRILHAKKGALRGT